ncbi:hypothetical protein KFL_014300010, partial [Klebsormidium nitens]
MTDQWKKDVIGFIICLIQRRIPLKNKEKHAGKIDKRIIAVEHHLFPMQDAASVERCILSINKAKEWSGTGTRNTPAGLSSQRAPSPCAKWSLPSTKTSWGRTPPSTKKTSRPLRPLRA